MDGQWIDDRSNQHKNILFAGRDNKDEPLQEPHGTEKQQLPSLNKEFLDELKPSLSKLKEIAVSTKNNDSLQDISKGLDKLAEGLRDDKAKLDKLETDNNKVMSDLLRITDHRKQILLTLFSLQADVHLLKPAGNWVQSNKALGIGALGALGVVHGTSDIMRLSRSESLGQAAIPAAGLIADTGLVAGALSFLSKNPTVAKYRAPFVMGAMAARMAVSAVDFGKTAFDTSK